MFFIVFCEGVHGFHFVYTSTLYLPCSWISKLSSGVFAQWAEPLVVLIVRVHDAGAFDVDYRGKLAVQRAEEEAAAAQHEHGAQGAAALAAVDVMRRRVQLAEKARRKMVWPRLEASLRQLLAQLARVAYLGDEVSACDWRWVHA